MLILNRNIYGDTIRPFHAIDGNMTIFTVDGALGWMLGATITEIVYAIMMAVNYFGNSNERKKEETGVFSVSLAESIYIILLMLASVTYIVWSLLEVTDSVKLLIYLLPTAIVSNFIWLIIRYIVNGVFRKN